MTLQVECHRCGYGWKYTGNSEYYASCPQCKTSVPLQGEASEPSDTESQQPTEQDAAADLDGLSDRVKDLESTASELHSAIETMMQRVAELEKRRKAPTSTDEAGQPSRSTASPAGGASSRGPERAAVEDGGQAADTHGQPSGGQSETGTGSPGHTTSEGQGRTVAAAPSATSGTEQDTGAEDPVTAGQTGGSPGQATTSEPHDGAATTGGSFVEPELDDDGSYDYVCPSCEGPISGQPDACIHCGADFHW